MTNAGLDGARVLVTGAGRGFGAALAITLADRGAHPILAARRADAASAVAETIAARGRPRPETVALDLASASSVEAAIDAVRERTDRLDVLVNNGSGWLAQDVDGYSAADVLNTVNSQISGTFLLIHGLLPLLQRSQRPDIVTIGSVSSLDNTPLLGAAAPFKAAKAGQAALMDGLREELVGTNVRAMTIHPPGVDDVSPLDAAWSAPRVKGDWVSNRDVVDCVLFALSRPRNVTIASMQIDADAAGLFSMDMSGGGPRTDEP